MKKKLLRTLQLAISIFLICVIYYKLDISFSKVTFSLVNYYWIGLAIFFRVFFMPYFAAMRWKTFLLGVGVNKSLMELVKINFQSAFWGISLPSSTGMDVIRIYLIEKNHPEARGKVGSTVVAERLIGFIVLSIIGFIGSLLIQDFNQIWKIRLILLSLIALLLIILVIGTQDKFHKICVKTLTKLRFGDRPIRYVEKLYGSLVEMPLRSILVRALPFMLMFQVSAIILGYLIFKAFDVNVPFLYHLTFLPLIWIITLIPVSISGFGVREGAFVYFYSSLGVSPTISFSVSILYYIISMGFPVICGAIISLSQHQRRPTN
jgi:uncharacterized protein (TIRG00374 family)